MNAVWGEIKDCGKIYIALSKHKTTENLEIKKSFYCEFCNKEN